MAKAHTTGVSGLPSLGSFIPSSPYWATLSPYFAPPRRPTLVGDDVLHIGQRLGTTENKFVGGCGPNR